MDKIVESQLEACRGNFLRHGDSPRGTYQNNQVTIEERHRQLLAQLRPFLPASFTLCDLGSGTCDLHGYLLKNGIQHRYIVFGIEPEMPRVASLIGNPLVLSHPDSSCARYRRPPYLQHSHLCSLNASLDRGLVSRS
jgi:hypothetical protein